MKSGKKTMHLYYWPIRGLVNPSILLCEYLQLDYEFHRFESSEEWSIQKETLLKEGLLFPDLPYLIDGKSKLS